MSVKSTQRVNIDLPIKTYDAIRKAAAADHRSARQVITLALVEKFGQKKEAK